ncbi:RNA polymerase recycling motor HelD [Priestia filamentosa]|uniref:RNA polymerase recycling motor HelD n=1 Tax=Priestia filamentosa TaxID=1402861 RepID=UPI003D2BFCC3
MEKSEERKFEEKRIEKVKKEIERQLNTITSYSGDLKTDVVHLRKTFWDDVTVNIENDEDAVETLASIKQQAEMLSERERTHGQLHKRFKTLSRLKDAPYFGRIDFREDGEKDKDIVYLGISSLMDEKQENFLIYDWRAPISSLYYDYSPGYAKYETVEGSIEGSMLLKRQFITKNGRITSMFDTGVTIGDELLKEVLGNNASTHMKTIVATIQKEQNALIRNEKSRYLIVQGAAGSGKTSAALQRVAYLLYRHLHHLTAENLMLFSPNPLFSSYVGTVLPELGEDNVKQTTYREYVEKEIGGRFKIENPFKQLEYILSYEETDFYEAKLAGIQYKATLSFQKLIDAYIDHLKEQDMIFKHIRFRGRMLIHAVKIKAYFYSLDSSISIPNRINLVVEWLLTELSKKEREEREEEWALEESELLETEDYVNVYDQLQREAEFSENTFNDFEREQKRLSRKIVKKYFKPLRAAVKKLKFIDDVALYKQLFKVNGLPVPGEWEKIKAYTLKNLRKKHLPYEDTAPYIYFLGKLQGQRRNLLVQHLFIDEAQDYSPFQLMLFQKLFPRCQMTILGDKNQAIYAHSINGETLLSPTLYNEEEREEMTLLKSYRSTREIVEFTKPLIQEGEKIEPFNRRGPKPVISKVDDSSHHRKIADYVKGFIDKGHKTIAIICKTARESREAYEELESLFHVQLMDEETYSFQKGTIILPVYLAKGIEFDAVIVYDASSHKYEKEFERNLFYTACTRAMHELCIFSRGPVSSFIQQANQETYREE